MESTWNVIKLTNKLPKKNNDISYVEKLAEELNYINNLTRINSPPKTPSQN